MPEKTIATIDLDLIIPKDEEKVFENQHIRLEAGIGCDGTLIFKNCTIEPCANMERKTGRKGRKSACTPGCISIGLDGKIRNGWMRSNPPWPEFPVWLGYGD